MSREGDGMDGRFDHGHDDERFTAPLSALLDDELAPADREALEGHLATCAQCRDTLEGLRSVREAAMTAPVLAAPDDVWAGIEARLGAKEQGDGVHGGARILAFPRRRASFPRAFMPQLVAAGFTLLLVAAGTLAMLRLPGVASRASAPVAVHTVAPDDGDAQAAAFDPVQVDGEIAALRSAVEHGRGKLDPKTVAVLEQDLAIIERATADAKSALARDPHNRDLQEYFATSMKDKLALVRHAAQMAGV